jgi:hypothetical protein
MKYDYIISRFRGKLLGAMEAEAQSEIDEWCKKPDHLLHTYNVVQTEVGLMIVVVLQRVEV